MADCSTLSAIVGSDPSLLIQRLLHRRFQLASEFPAHIRDTGKPLRRRYRRFPTLAAATSFARRNAPPQFVKKIHQKRDVIIQALACLREYCYETPAVWSQIVVPGAWMQ